jgi:N-acetylglucosaminyldiphosphoundecaprenol N-acetyl-beta-D-mannosaminyltransferase
MVVSAQQSAAVAKAVNKADLTVPDGAPVAWVLRQQGFREQRRVAGPDLMWSLCESAARRHFGVYLLGSTSDTLERLKTRLRLAFPGIVISGSHAPPFRQMTAHEEDDLVTRISESGARLVFVALGCPKQELWMAAQRGRVHAIMVGVGAAFDFHAGTVKRAPLWMQGAGLEWLYRLVCEPKRLWKRYLVTNTIFIVSISWRLLVKR